MKPFTACHAQGGRWILIIAEAVVASYLVLSVAAGNPSWRGRDYFSGLEIIVFMSWITLFLGAPFMVSSHRWLAVAGWSTAVLALVWSVGILTP